MNEICFGVANLNVEENKCSTKYFSDAELVQLDGFFFADRCRTVERKLFMGVMLKKRKVFFLFSLETAKLCDAECDLGQQCQWVDGEEMCVCSRESCSSSSVSDVDRKPICASNNMTFSSLCEMEAWKCLNYRSSLYKKYDGECQSNWKKVLRLKKNDSFFLFNRGLSKCEMSWKFDLCFGKKYGRTDLLSETSLQPETESGAGLRYWWRDVSECLCVAFKGEQERTNAWTCSSRFLWYVERKHLLINDSLTFL